MSEEKLTRVLRELLDVVRIARSMSEERLARALRELLGGVRIADTASVGHLCETVIFGPGGDPVYQPDESLALSDMEAAMTKLYVSESCLQSSLDAIQVHGANGYSNEFPVERYLRNSKAAVIYEGTSQLHTLIQADYALGYREDRPLRCEPWPPT